MAEVDADDFSGRSDDLFFEDGDEPSTACKIEGGLTGLEVCVCDGMRLLDGCGRWNGRKTRRLSCVPCRFLLWIGGCGHCGGGWWGVRCLKRVVYGCGDSEIGLR